MQLEEVILVNELDIPQGRMEKMEAHRRALLHRAFSVFIFNSRGEMLLSVPATNKKKRRATVSVTPGSSC